MIWVALLIGFAILGIVIYFSMKAHNKLVAEGKIISRRTDFAEDAEEFTFRAVEPAQITEAVKALDYGDMHAGMKGSSERQIFKFTGSGWAAQLYRMEAEDAQMRYRFEFTNWKTRNGMPQDALNMNKLLTAVEKVFLSFDPSAQVRAVPLELKTRHNFL